MTESVSGFLTPEERTALASRKRSERPDDETGITIAILQVLSADGPTAIPELLSKVKARPRSVLAAIDDLEGDRLVRVDQDGTEEIVGLTERGRAKLMQTA